MGRAGRNGVNNSGGATGSQGGLKVLKFILSHPAWGAQKKGNYI